MARIRGGQLFAANANVPWATLLARTFDLDVTTCACWFLSPKLGWMGAFNTVVIQDRDIALDRDVEVQFKHGLVRQFRYRVGDALRWPADRALTHEELEADVPGLARVGADRYVDYLVRIRRGVISDVERVRADRCAPRSTFAR